MKLKNHFNKILSLGKHILISLSVFICIWIWYATLSSLSDVSSWDTFTATMWNTVLNQVKDNTATLSPITNSGGNIGIGTNNPIGKLEIIHRGTIGHSWILEYAGLTVSDSSKSSSMAIDNNEITQKGDHLYLSAQTGDISFRTDFNNDNAVNTQMIIKKDGNVWIGTASPTQKLDVNGNMKANSLYTQGGKIQRDFLTRNTRDSWNTPIHIKTNIPTKSSIMYKIQVEGYNYGDSKIINSEAVGYTYNHPSNNCIFRGSVIDYASGITLTQYCSSDNFVVLKLTMNSHYYLGFSASASFLNPSGWWHKISAEVFKQSSDL